MKNPELINVEKRDAIIYWKKRYEVFYYVFFPLMVLLAVWFVGWAAVQIGQWVVISF